MPLLQATFCWLLRHSALAETDGLLIGASSLAQLEANLEACEMAKDGRASSRDLFDIISTSVMEGSLTAPSKTS